MSNKAVSKHPKLPHVEWIDINDEGIAVECIVVKRDKNNGDVYFLETQALDRIDLDRLTSILQKRDADKYQLWDLLDNTTLANGENALEFYHQLVKVCTAQNRIMTPKQGQMGIRIVEEKPRGPGRPKGS
jgi:hypothetical protein